MSNFYSLTFLRVAPVWRFKAEVLLLLPLLLPFTLLCFKLSPFSKSFWHFCSYYLNVHQESCMINMPQRTRNAAPWPYSLSAYERLREMIHCAKWFQRYNISLQDLSPVGLFCLFYILVCHRLTLILNKWIKMDLPQILVCVTLLVNWAETFIMDALILKI